MADPVKGCGLDELELASDDFETATNTSVIRCCFDRLNTPWDPRSGGTTVPAGRRARTALSSAATASEDFIRESIEYPTILPE